tara:strand:- start:1505 stop:2179 length:675 start_codon:yes stop_codon:yes gene_type:complete
MNPIKHLAIIMDGNGRWGIKHKNSRNLGHKEGLKTVEMVLRETSRNNIKFLTLFVFSTENWKRPVAERNFLFNLLENFLESRLEEIHKKNIKIKIIGKKLLNKKLSNLLKYAETKTINNTKVQVNIALNYGSKSEIVYALNKLKKSKKGITEQNISKNMYTNKIPDPDLLIRTGNTKRLSNFLLWQIAYSEIYFEKKLWPDFNKTDFNRIIRNFKNIKRNFGNI